MIIMAINIDEVIRLSQDEGLFDHEISDQLGCHRVTITRIRQRHHIPRPNLRNRKDKEQECKKCGKITLLRRKQRITKYCDHCKQVQEALRREKKRQYMKERKK